VLFYATIYLNIFTPFSRIWLSVVELKLELQAGGEHWDMETKTGIPGHSPGAGRGDNDGYIDENTILVQRTLRSGQKIFFDGNVVVLGDVNPGAEIVASGNVIVMGVLRGVVHAGASGDEKAMVMAFRLRPTQLRISNHITRPPDEDAETDQPEVAKIRNGMVTIELFNSGVERQGKIS